MTTVTAHATANQAGLIVKGRVAGIARGWAFPSGSFKSDRSRESPRSASALFALAASGSELTYTLVDIGSQTRAWNRPRHGRRIRPG